MSCGNPAAIVECKASASGPPPGARPVPFSFIRARLLARMVERRRGGARRGSAATQALPRHVSTLLPKRRTTALAQEFSACAPRPHDASRRGELSSASHTSISGSRNLSTFDADRIPTSSPARYRRSTVSGDKPRYSATCRVVRSRSGTGETPWRRRRDAAPSFAPAARLYRYPGAADG